MKVLIVTNMLAGRNPAQPSQGIFVSEQVDALRRLPDTQVDVMVVKGFASRFAYAGSALRLWRRLRTSRYDIVHYHFGLTACTAALVRTFSDARIVLTLHGSDVLGGRLSRAVSLAAARFAHACIAVSDEIRDAIRSVNPRCTTIPCGVDDTLFRPLCDEPEEQSFRTVVFPSSASRPEKDYPLFAEALRIAKRHASLPIVERHIDGLDRSEVCRLLQGADAMLMTSKREGSPQSVKEAMACGLPVVSVNVGDVDRMLSGVRQCRVADGRDPDTLAALLLEVLETRERSDGPLHLERRGYRSSQVAARVHALYQMLLSRRDHFDEESINECS
ncbi:glycosyltransferase family 4 protein [Burkholderia cepacia]|uniref:glycosyltransferase family 4 protein n=1 Tax=Burkholderia cepacia TaxID=292 RepID=UPI001CF56881|nr:glycosyltransferase family 4 protein [Burkholderia cepacia]MCA7977728.1 glycosyltransferase family 4 protein [Burkholderia cepacia]